MDPRRHGKLPLSSETSKEEEKEDTVQEFDAYATWSSETDMSAMVSALSQVMGTSNRNPPMSQSTSFPFSNFDTKDQPQPQPQPQPSSDKGLLPFLSSFNSSFFCVFKFRWMEMVHMQNESVFSQKTKVKVESICFGVFWSIVVKFK